MIAETRTFPRSFMLDVLYGGVDGARVIQDQLVDASQWARHYDLVFEYEGKFYGAEYTRGAAEQEMQPWEYQSDVTCMVVEPVETRTIEYKPVAKQA